MPLTDTAIRAAKPQTKPLKLSDGGGLFLLITPKGGKWWRYSYRYAGKQKTISLGTYPDISLKDARESHSEARKLLAKGTDPGEIRKAIKSAREGNAANSFEVVAREWFSRHKHSWADSHSEKIISRLENDVFPWLGSRPIAEITAPELLTVIRRAESRGALDTAHRVRQNCGQVFRYAIATGRAERDPAHDLRGAIPPAATKNFPSITEPAEVAELLRAIDGFKGTFVVRCALLLAPMVFVRPGELRTAEWSGINLKDGNWRYFVTKTKTEHQVPLSTQAVSLLTELYPLTGHGKYVFPGRDPNKPMSEAAVNAALRRLGYDTKTEITGHGFRAMARTILHEKLGMDPNVIEHQLAHKVPDALGSAYNRTKFLAQRKEMMQLWADYLDSLKAGAMLKKPVQTVQAT